jgi:hypothetical protein
LLGCQGIPEKICFREAVDRRRIAGLQVDEVSRILILYDAESNFIGDFCSMADRPRQLKKLIFPGAGITVSFPAELNMTIYSSLLENNPGINSFFAIPQDEIDFLQYDILLCISNDETKILDHLGKRYFRPGKNNDFDLCVFSISQLLNTGRRAVPIVFPYLEQLNVMKMQEFPVEIHLSSSERKWAEQWLEQQGVKDDEKLFIILDSASRRNKLMQLKEYFYLLQHYLEKDKIKILNFDEKNMGKEEFYRSWLNEEYMGKLIFSKRMTLRQAFAILGSKYTRFIFGPCTGLMHCASAIYNNYVSSGCWRQPLPVIVIYTGQYHPEEGTAYSYWGNAPLVNCLLLKKQNGQNAIVELSSLSAEERKTKDTLPAREYTAEALLKITDRLLGFQAL